MQITGKDEISVTVLKEFEKGVRIKAIVERFPISLDQAKRLSRYYNILQKAKYHLNETLLGVLPTKRGKHTLSKFRHEKSRFFLR